MEKRRRHGQVRGLLRHPTGMGGAVVGGLFAALMATDARAAQLPELTGAEHLSKAIAAIEQGDGQSVLPGLQSMTAEGDAQAAYLLGAVWHKGLGVRRDFAKAREAYAAAAFLGNPRAMNELGLLYRDGLGVVADPIEAVAWFRVAAEYNLTEAMENRDKLETELTSRDRAAGRALALRRELEIDLLSRDKLGAPPKVPTRAAQNASTRDIALAMLRQDAENTSQEQAGPSPTEPTGTGKEEQDPTAPASAQSYLVQIGVFAKPESIRRIRDEARALGFPIRETERTVNGTTATRLTAGPFASEEEARQAAAKLNTALKVTTRVMPATS